MGARAFRGRRHIARNTDGLAAVTFYFNYANCPRLRQNAERFLEHWKGFEVPLYVVEVVFGRRKPHLTGSNVVVVRVMDQLFHKESAVNYAVRHLPREKTMITWIDSDLIFDLRRLRLLPAMLERHRAVQLFSEIQYLGPDGEHEDRLKRSFVEDQRNGYHGGGWAMRRELFEAIGGLSECSITGGGDSVFLMALYGPQLVDRWSWYIDKHHDALRANMRQYAASGHELLRGSVGCLGIKAQHLWHGTTNQREYQSRHRIIADLTAANTQLDSNGFVELVHAPKVRLAIADYWKRRKCNE